MRSTGGTLSMAARPGPKRGGGGAFVEAFFRGLASGAPHRGASHRVVELRCQNQEDMVDLCVLLNNAKRQ